MDFWHSVRSQYVTKFLVPPSRGRNVQKRNAQGRDNMHVIEEIFLYSNNSTIIR
jgi:hypothetical protein